MESNIKKIKVGHYEFMGYGIKKMGGGGWLINWSIFKNGKEKIQIGTSESKIEAVRTIKRILNESGGIYFDYLTSDKDY